MWDLYTDEMKRDTSNRSEDTTEYGVCLNKVPDYIVGVEADRLPGEDETYYGYTITRGTYIKASFNGKDHEDLVSGRLMAMQKQAKKWVKENKVKCDNRYTVEVYPKDTMEQEYPEMYLLLPIVK